MPDPTSTAAPARAGGTLKRLAEASLSVTEAEEAIAQGEHHHATERLDQAVEGLDALRAAWIDLSPAERAIVGAPAAELKARIGAARARIPRLSALSVGTAVSDPEEEQDPHP